MRVIGLTGSIGSGKTTVLKFVRSFRVAAIDSDAIVAKLHREKKVQAKLKKLFGTSKRKELAAIVFQSPAKRKKLEALLHPLVWKEVKRKLFLYRKQKRKLAFVDVPLLFEANWQNRFGLVIFVKAPKEKCIQRLMRKRFSKKDALLRWNAQLSPGKKVKSADCVIDNSASFANTRKQVRLLIESLS